MTPPPDPGSAQREVASEDSSPSWPILLLMVAVPALVASCGLLIWAISYDGGEVREPETMEIVVPAGTQDRLDAGEAVVLMPTRIELRVGDRLMIRNDDATRHFVGPYPVEPGENMLIEYGAPGTYQGYCALSDGEQYEIVITA